MFRSLFEAIPGARQSSGGVRGVQAQPVFRLESELGLRWGGRGGTLLGELVAIWSHHQTVGVDLVSSWFPLHHQTIVSFRCSFMAQVNFHGCGKTMT